ncbi:LOW QUALITY PROTEIN: hypothetical protein M8C21_020038 [Ambrosia artemisiifolia]|uniref:F-box domain-containing protein n=1 Tax=Ambrosia artemisiifolia TaxID=4212 RepID=A0AAD5GV22_AMBAR|nr:LOW QUALITY PROTEIN: hypothetical protein M8C21_020038 [Ambrosia artemisiifolia]
MVSAEEDILTNFPQDLINPILERLPVKEAVRTSVLSKKWRYRWTTMKTLDLYNQFSQQFLEIGGYQHNGFIRVISQIMTYHHGPILKFHLHIPKEINLDSFQEVDQWIFILRILVSRVESVDPPFEFQGFPNLQHINLLYVNFGGGTVINLPQLKILSLVSCRSVNKFNIKAEKLQALWVTGCPDANAMVLQLLHSEHLNVILAAEKFPKWLPHAVNCLEKLKFISFSFGDLNQLQGALCMLRNSPNLEVLRVTPTQMGPEADLGLTSTFLESPDCLDQTSLMLNYVEMTSLEGSRPELLFVKLLLHCSPHLEKMIIRPAATLDAEKRLNITKDVLMFSRASTKAKVAFLDPQP